METCDRCGCELFDFYHFEYFHSHEGNRRYKNLCPECKRQFDAFLDGYDVVYAYSDNYISTNAPDGYEPIVGGQD